MHMAHSLWYYTKEGRIGLGSGREGELQLGFSHILLELPVVCFPRYVLEAVGNLGLKSGSFCSIFQISLVVPPIL